MSDREDYLFTARFRFGGSADDQYYEKRETGDVASTGLARIPDHRCSWSLSCQPRRLLRCRTTRLKLRRPSRSAPPFLSDFLTLSTTSRQFSQIIAGQPSCLVSKTVFACSMPEAVSATLRSISHRSLGREDESSESI